MLAYGWEINYIDWICNYLNFVSNGLCMEFELVVENIRMDLKMWNDFMVEHCNLKTMVEWNIGIDGLCIKLFVVWMKM